MAVSVPVSGLSDPDGVLFRAAPHEVKALLKGAVVAALGERQRSIDATQIENPPERGAAFTTCCQREAAGIPGALCEFVQAHFGVTLLPAEMERHISALVAQQAGQLAPKIEVMPGGDLLLTRSGMGRRGF